MDSDRDILEQRVEQRTEQLRRLNAQLKQQIEERRQIEIDLQQSELRYRSIVEDQAEQIVRFDANGVIEFANRAYLQANGLTTESAVGASLYQFLPESEHDRIRRQLQSVSPETPTGGGVLRVCGTGGINRWEEWHGRAIFDEAGRLMTFQAVGRDVTALKQVQDQLRQSELHYRSIVEDQTEMIVRFDSEGRITFANKAYCQANGQTLSQLIGQPYYFRIHEDDRQAVMQLVKASNKQAPSQASESRAYRPDGTIAYEAWTGRALFDEDGRHCGFQAVGRDVSQLHEARRKLQEKELQLTHLARVSALGEMVAGISHEINQPLATIANFCSAALLLIQQTDLQNDSDDSLGKLNAWLIRISRQTDRINAIIQRLKRFGRPGGQAETFQIGIAIDEALMVTEMQTRQLLEKIEVIDSTRKCWICADRIQIEQVLVNLIRNACEAMEPLPEDQRQLKIEAKHSNQFVVITVTDSGPGISSAAAADVFDSFVTSKSHGMGIGLAISRSIVENHGGRIRAIADVGYGCVEFALPAINHSVQADLSSVSTSHWQPAGQLPRGNLSDRGCPDE